MDAFLDGEMDTVSRAAIQIHLDECDDCASVLNQLENHDGRLRKAIGVAEDNSVVSARVDSIVARTKAQLREEFAVLPVGAMEKTFRNCSEANSVAPTQKKSTQNKFWHLAVGLAGGFLIALCLFQPWQDTAEPLTSNIVDETSVVARLSVVSDAVESRQDSKKSWRQCSFQSELRANTELRTGGNSVCELERGLAPVLRLAADSWVELESGTSFRLFEGRVWVSARQAPVVLRCGEQEIKVRSGAADVRYIDGELTALTLNGELSVSSAQLPATANTQTVTTSQRFTSLGEHTSITDISDPVMETRWLHEVLSKKHHAPELNERVEKILATMGMTKMQHLHESEIRSLGSRAGAPLLAYLHSAAAEHQNSRQRVTAARLLADIANYEHVDQLIGLLDDKNSAVIEYVEKALQRISGRSPNRKAKQPSINEWKRWRQESRDSEV